MNFISNFFKMEPKCDIDDLVLAPVDDAEWFDYHPSFFEGSPWCVVPMLSPVLGTVYVLAQREKVIEYFGEEGSCDECDMSSE